MLAFFRSLFAYFQLIPQPYRELIGVGMVAILLRWVGVKLIARIGRSQRLRNMSHSTAERQKTLNSMLIHLFNIAMSLGTAILMLSYLVPATNLLWFIGLFSAAFGIGANRVVSDYMHGLSFLFEDDFRVREKVEIAGVIGIVEQVNMRTTRLRGQNGELLIVPNGEIRTLRNFSRGEFSPANVHLHIFTRDVGVVTDILNDCANEALLELPDLIEPWLVINEKGEMAITTELTVLAKARFGKAAELRPKLLEWIYHRLLMAKIEIQP
jgi:small conductance mechanosensitive channel